MGKVNRRTYVSRQKSQKRKHKAKEKKITAQYRGRKVKEAKSEALKDKGIRAFEELSPKERKLIEKAKNRAVRKLPFAKRTLFRGVELYARSVCLISDTASKGIKNYLPTPLRVAGQLTKSAAKWAGDAFLLSTIGATMDDLGLKGTGDKALDLVGKTLVGRDVTDLTNKMGDAVKESIIETGSNLPAMILENAVNILAAETAQELGCYDAMVKSEFITDFCSHYQEGGTAEKFVQNATMGKLGVIGASSITNVKILKGPLKATLVKALKKTFL